MFRYDISPSNDVMIRDSVQRVEVKLVALPENAINRLGLHNYYRLEELLP